MRFGVESIHARHAASATAGKTARNGRHAAVIRGKNCDAMAGEHDIDHFTAAESAEPPPVMLAARAMKGRQENPREVAGRGRCEISG